MLPQWRIGAPFGVEGSAGFGSDGRATVEAAAVGDVVIAGSLDFPALPRALPADSRRAATDADAAALGDLVAVAFAAAASASAFARASASAAFALAFALASAFASASAADALALAFALVATTPADAACDAAAVDAGPTAPPRPTRSPTTTAAAATVTTIAATTPVEKERDGRAFAAATSDDSPHVTSVDASG